MKLSILLLVGELYPELNANSLIAYHIGQELKEKYDCEVSIYGWHSHPENEASDNPYGLYTISVDSIQDYYDVIRIRGNRFRKLIKFIFTPRVTKIYFHIKNKDFTYAMKCEYIHGLKRVLKQKKYDCVIGFTTPYLIYDVMMTVNMNCILISYMLDPWSTCYMCRNEFEETKRKEIQIANKVDAIISSKLVQQDYINKLRVNDYILSKFYALDYPNIIKIVHENKKRMFDREKIHCVFTGKLYDTIRKPQYTIDLFKRLNKSNVIFHIVGRLGSTDPRSLPSNVIWHGEVTNDEANSYMLAADILINIGNTELNLMPSKIFTYMSTGKPIINIFKDLNCPTLPYLLKYPLVCNVLETQEVQEKDVNKVRQFIFTNRGKRISFETVKKLYYECTPEYVGKRVFEIINRSLEIDYDER